MVNTCVVYGCSNSYLTGHGVHQFPPEPSKKAEWTRFVKTKRQNFKTPKLNSRAVICEAHFAPECYNAVQADILREMGAKVKKILLTGSVPTIQSVTQVGSKRPLDPLESVPKRRATTKLQVARLLQSSAGPSIPEIQETVLKLPTQIQTVAAASHCGVPKEKAADFHKATQCKLVPSARSKAVNTCPSLMVDLAQQRRPLMVDMGTQCMLLTDDDLPQAPRAASTPVKKDQDSSIELSPIKPSFREDEDPDYKPSEMSIEACIEEDACKESEPQPTSSTEFTPKDYATEPKYIVFQHKLLELFQTCPVCLEPTVAEEVDPPHSGHGTLVKINQSCTSCGFRRTWESQPYSRKTPVGNLLLSAAVLLSGSQISQVLRLFSIMKIKCYSRSTYQRQQSSYIIPTVVNKWKRDQSTLLEHLREKPDGLDLAGDCRNDSPGHSAKYGCYTLMEQSSNKVLDLQIVQSNEAGSSNACELVGFKRSLSYITETEQMKVNSLVTDRHMGIAAHIRDEVIPFNPQCNELKHYNDVWHTAKGLRKKIEKIGLKDHLANVWKRSILNHVYYVAANAPEENREAYIDEMWVSLVNHLHDNHTHLENELYLYCDHAHLVDDRDKQWLRNGTCASRELKELIRSDRVRKDIKKLSPKYQTSSLEAFHSLIIRFAPKHTSFSWLGMIARTYIAAMHHNENANRMQAETDDGVRQFKVCFPKYKGGDHTVKTVRTSCTYVYTDDLVLQLLEDYDRDPRALKNSIWELRREEPERLTASLAHPDKEEAVQQHLTRFNL